MILDRDVKSQCIAYKKANEVYFLFNKNDKIQNKEQTFFIHNG